MVWAAEGVTRLNPNMRAQTRNMMIFPYSPDRQRGNDENDHLRAEHRQVVGCEVHRKPPFVIPGRAKRREPGIHNHRIRGYEGACQIENPGVMDSGLRFAKPE